MEQFEALEIRSLANPNRALQFVMLSDFIDSDQEEDTEDESILQAAKTQLDKLNRRYKSSYGDRFVWLHRKRRWNPSENVWMGWPRKLKD